MGAGRPRREHRRVEAATAGHEHQDVIGRGQRGELVVGVAAPANAGLRSSRSRRRFVARRCSSRWTSARPSPARASTAAWSGLSATATAPLRKKALLEPGLAIDRATRRRSRSGEPESSASSTNTTECGASTPTTVTTESSGSNPAATEHGSHGDSAMFSARHIVNLPGWPSSAMSDTPGRAPPMFIRQRRTARPIEALARWPGPRAPKPPAIPQASARGPLTTISGVVECVVLWASDRSYSGRSSARSAARTIGRWSGSHPAMTAFTATFSTVVAAPSGPITPRLVLGSATAASAMRAARSGVGTTTGRPSVQPRRCSCSRAAASSGARSTVTPRSAPSGSLSASASPRSTATIRGASASARRAIAWDPLPATGWGRRSRGTSGIPLDKAMRSPWGQN